MMGAVFLSLRKQFEIMEEHGIDEQGATNTDSLLIKTERAMIERSRELITLADSSKFNHSSSFVLGSLSKKV